MVFGDPLQRIKRRDRIATKGVEAPRFDELDALRLLSVKLRTPASRPATQSPYAA
jgi:hypothetical protein